MVPSQHSREGVGWICSVSFSSQELRIRKSQIFPLDVACREKFLFRESKTISSQITDHLQMSKVPQRPLASAP